MKKTWLFGMLLSGIAAFANPQVPLWQGKAPEAKAEGPKHNPTIEYYPVAGAKTKTPAIVIFPGGGYGGLAVGHEGENYARFFNQQGYAAYVVRYRLGSAGYRHPTMLHDAARAVRTVRFHAEKNNINPEKIGVIGSSAGGHLAATILTQFDAGNPKTADPIDRVSSRPNFGVLCYPVITMGKFTHGGSRDNLLGRNADPRMLDLLSAEKQVKKDTPPCFIWHTSNDTVVPVENSLMFSTALRAQKIPFELHIYPKGPHGMGLGGGYPFKKILPWGTELTRWLKETVQ